MSWLEKQKDVMTPRKGTESILGRHTEGDQRAWALLGCLGKVTYLPVSAAYPCTCLLFTPDRIAERLMVKHFGKCQRYEKILRVGLGEMVLPEH